MMTLLQCACPPKESLQLPVYSKEEEEVKFDVANNVSKQQQQQRSGIDLNRAKLSPFSFPKCSCKSKSLNAIEEEEHKDVQVVSRSDSSRRNHRGISTSPSFIGVDGSPFYSCW
jgi:hypothetical protein